MLATTLDPKLVNPTEEHEMLRQTVRDFTRKEIEPQAEEYDRKGELNRSLLTRAGELGLLGITIPEDFGGADMDTTASVIAHEEMAASDPGFTLAYLAHALLFVNNLFYAANDDQRKRYIPKTVSGEWVGAMAMTEPSAGTDVLGMGTTATKKGDRYILQGRKIFITNAPEANVFLVYAKVDGRITSFIVERDFKGFSVSEKIKKMGMRASTMAELVLEEVEVPEENLVGKEGGGITNMMRNLEIERLGLAAMSLGMAKRCLDIMLRYSVDRKAFGNSIAEFGQIQTHIGESFAKVEAMRGLIYGAASTIGPDKRNRPASDAAKLFSGRAAKEVADSAMQVLGGYGYCDEYRVEQFLRDSKLIEIGGGTNEAHQKNITRDLVRAIGEQT